MKLLLAFAAVALTACSAPQPSSSHAAAPSGDSIGRFLVKAELPRRVKDVVSEVTRIGREEGDFFGIQRLAYFEIPTSSARPRLKAIVADVIEASRDHGPYSVADFCLNGEDDLGRELAFDDDHECAAYLIGHERSPRLETVIEGLRTWHEAGSSEAVRMNKALGHIQKFLGRTVGGSDQEEIAVSMTGLNVSEENIILINKDKGHVVVLKFDEGA